MALLLSEEDVRRVLTMPMALAAVEDSLAALGSDKASNHPRRRHRTDGGIYHVMDAALPTQGVVGLKCYTTARGGGNRFNVLIYSVESGELLAMIEADWLGRYRTGAASGVSAKYMARKHSKSLGIIGAGGQAFTQVLAICEACPIEDVRVFCRTKETREKFALDASEAAGTKVTAVDSAEATVEGADIVVTATNSREPVLLGDWLREGTHVVAMGANNMLRNEIDARVIARATTVALDSKEQARQESGALTDAVQNTSVEWNNFVELGEIICGRQPGRRNDSDITLFVSHGLAIWDVSLGVRVLEACRGDGLGKTWP